LRTADWNLSNSEKPERTAIDENIESVSNDVRWWRAPGHDGPRRQKNEELGYSSARDLSGPRAMRIIQGCDSVRKEREVADSIGESVSNEFYCAPRFTCWILPTVVFFRQRGSAARSGE